MREKPGRFKFSASNCALKITKKELGLWPEMGYFGRHQNQGSGLGLISAMTGDISRANRPAFRRAVFPDQVKSTSTKGSCREIFRFLAGSVGDLSSQR